MEKLKRILMEINDEIDFDSQTALVDDGLLDSLELLKIIAALDDEYGIVINQKTIEPESFNSLESIYALVQHYLETKK